MYDILLDIHNKYEEEKPLKLDKKAKGKVKTPERDQDADLIVKIHNPSSKDKYFVNIDLLKLITQKMLDVVESVVNNFSD
jgi:hypothetical protein